MECNKEEAVRAKDIAEKKMLSRDFDGAKKLLLKALHLCPDIENGSHMLTVCEVHCSARSLVNGQKDHYGVLQVEPLADETLIRKQYRRLALLLHPDKNKFAGAEAAFKLVGEAYKVLSDQTSRVVYDSKRRVEIRTIPSWNSRNVGINTGATIYASHYHQYGVKQQDKQQSSEFFASQYFWSVCVHCNNLFQYPRSLLNREVQCQRCLKKVHAFEVTPQNVPPPGSDSGFPWRQTGFQQTDVSTQYSHNNWSHTHFGKSSGTRVHENVARHPAASEPSKSVFSTTQGYGYTNNVEKAGSGGLDMEGNQISSEKRKPGEKPAVKNPLDGPRRIRTAASSTDSGLAQNGSTGSDKIHPTVLKNDRYPRRTARDKVNIIYKEYESEDDFAYPPKRSRKAGSYNIKDRDISSPVIVQNIVKKKSNENPSGKQIGEDLCKNNLQRGSGLERGMIPESKGPGSEEDKHAGSNANPAVDSRQLEFSFSYPDAEFYNFDMDRDQSKFAVNQIWAVYDDDDGMPRYYALIRKVFATGFKLQYTWLEYNPTSLAEKAWVKARLPTACGNFKIGKVCNTRCQLMFSHLICGEKGRESTYDIYPKKGEIWALFNDWDVQWSSFEQGPKNYVYEFVEVLSDYATGQDFTVNHLVKVKGFLYLFARAQDKGITVIPSGQLLKFSHCIPFFRVSLERDGIPRDSFELDPAALPGNVVCDAGNAHNIEIMDVKTSDTCLRSQPDEDKFDGEAIRSTMLRPTQDVQDISDIKSRDPASRNSCESIKGPSCNTAQESANFEFFDFQEKRLKEKFKQGQIWALYSDTDANPIFYAWVKKAEWAKRGLSVKLLEFSPQTEEEKLWLKNGLPVGCGRFKILSKVTQYGSTHSFSHMVHANSIQKNYIYEIYPNCGEIWAVFSNWSLKWTFDDFDGHVDYTVVEVLERDKCVIKVLILTKAKDYKHIFMPESTSVAQMDIPIHECLRFSHQIPAFRLNNQESGKLKDCWELEPKSIPKILSSLKS